MDQPHLDTLSTEDLYSEISDLAQERGVSAQAQWDELVESVIEDHLELGELNSDQNLTAKQEVLKSRWADYQTERGFEPEEKE